MNNNSRPIISNQKSPLLRDREARARETNELLQKRDINAKTAHATGIVNCTIGTAFIIAAIMNAFEHQYDNTILCSAAGIISTLLGAISIYDAATTRTQIQEMRDLQNRLKSFYDHTWQR